MYLFVQWIEAETSQCITYLVLAQQTLVIPHITEHFLENKLKCFGNLLSISTFLLVFKNLVLLDMMEHTATSWEEMTPLRARTGC